MNYYFLKKQLVKTPLVPMQQESFENILSLVHGFNQKNKNLLEVIESYFEETRHMYDEAMQRSIIQSVLVAPEVRGLENELRSPLPKEPE
jgi:hypothetical protein